MRRIGAVAMTGAQRMARMRQRRWLAQTAAIVTSDLEQLPLWVDPEDARPVVEAWRGRGLMYPLSAAQWATLGDMDADVAERAAQAVREGPRAPAPASALWGFVMAKVRAVMTPVVEALRVMATPAKVAYALPLDVCPPWVHMHGARAVYRDADCSP